MKRIISYLVAAACTVAPLQALPMLDCATLVANTSGKGVFNGNGAPYLGGSYAQWALDQIGNPELVPGNFSKQDTSVPEVTLEPGVLYLMLHWGNGQSGDQAYQLWDVGTCPPGSYELPAPSRNGISWIGTLRGEPTPDPSGDPVADGGSTALLLGLMALGFMPLRKRLRRK